MAQSRETLKTVRLDRRRRAGALVSGDAMTIFDDDTPISLLQALQPDVLVNGDEYVREQVVGWEDVDAYGGRIITLPMLAGCSTTAVVRQICCTAAMEILHEVHSALAFDAHDLNSSFDAIVPRLRLT